MSYLLTFNIFSPFPSHFVRTTGDEQPQTE